MTVGESNRQRWSVATIYILHADGQRIFIRHGIELMYVSSYLHIPLQHSYDGQQYCLSSLSSSSFSSKARTRNVMSSHDIGRFRPYDPFAPSACARKFNGGGAHERTAYCLLVTHFTYE